MKPQGRRAGFSLTELLTVTVIILVLLSVLIIGVDSVYEHSLQLQCQHRLETIGQACQMYFSSYNRLPSAWDMYARRRWYETLAATYIADPQALGCPAADTVPIQEGEIPEPPPSNITDPVLAALRWLKAHQESDGRWEPATHSGSRSSSDCGDTGLALMAFLGYGCTGTYPEEFAATVTQAINYLISRQGSDGRFPGHGGYWAYDHHVATMALGHAYLLTGHPGAKQAAQKGVNYTVSLHHADHGGFGYDVNKNDASVTGWAIQAIWMADRAGLQVNKGKVDLCLETMVYPSDYSCWYRYCDPYNKPTSNHRHHGATAISLTCRLLMDHKVGASANMSSKEGRCRGVLDWLRNDPHYYSYARTSGDLLYYYYYMTLANSLLGDTQWENWTTTQPGAAQPVFPHEIIEHQQADGHWPTSICRWGSYGGTVYTTALACMTLEAALEEHWQEEPVQGQCSYGYSARLGTEDRTPAPDTAIVMDALHWMINYEDDPSYVSARHGGQVNVLFFDGHVDALYPEEITEGTWTLDAGD